MCDADPVDDSRPDFEATGVRVVLNEQLDVDAAELVESEVTECETPEEKVFEPVGAADKE